MEILLPESAGKQMEWNGNHYKLLQIVQKTFADLFVYSYPKFEGLHDWTGIAVFLVIIWLVACCDLLFSDPLHQLALRMMS